MFLLLLLALIGLSQQRVTYNESRPILPLSLPEIVRNASYNKHIPRKLWIAVKDRNDQLPSHLLELFRRNPDWEINICDNLCKDEFMRSVFAHTQVHWVYNTINPAVGAARADVWRYAVMYTYGGVYLDDDSDIRTPLDEIISSKDRLIMSEEGASSLGDCYIPTYHLSDQSTFSRFSNFSLAPHYSGVESSTNLPQFFHGHTLINWGMFSSPRHPLFARTLRNIVEIVKSEYFRVSVVHMNRWDVKWKQVMCTTGFTLTFTLREMELEGSLPLEYVPRISVNNFKEYNGRVKAFWTGGDPSHYMKAMQRKNGPHILKDFSPLNIERVVEFLEGRAVMGDTGKEIYLIHNRQKYTFGSYELFLKLNFTDRSTRHVTDHILGMIPYAGVLNSEDVLKKPSTITTSTNTTDLKPFLTDAMKRIQNKNLSCFGDDYDGTRDDYLHDTHKNIIGEVPVMVFPFCLRTFQLGNTLGYYLNDIACADLAGAHFFAVNNNFNILDPSSLATKSETDRYAFFQALPSMIIHGSPRSPAEVKDTLRKQCHCLQFCWENSEAPWLQRVPLIREVLLPAINNYLTVSQAERIGTVLNKETDLCCDRSSMDHMNKAEDKRFPDFLPLIPNVTIQYRCGDNVGFGRTKYGLLPFSVYNKKRIPESIAQYIYIIADSPTRNPASVYSGRCETILQHLFKRVTETFPKAVVVLKRGGDPFLDYARIVYSKVVVCSASTFCVWPGLANNVGEVHFPLTPLIAKASSNITAPKLKENFHWIDEVEMIKQFKHYRPWTKLIDDLEAM